MKKWSLSRTDRTFFQMNEIVDAIKFCKSCGLPVNFSDLNIDQIDEKQLMKAAEASCAENNTMSNMPFEVKPEDVFAAMKTADTISRTVA